MKEMSPLKKTKKARVGLYSSGLHAYWVQFPGLRERLIEYGKFIETKMSDFAEVKNYGLVDTEMEARKAGEWLNSQNVDIVFVHCATYVTSACILPVHQFCKAPVIVLNLQPTARINYEKTDTGEWLAHCGACVVPEISNAFNRSGIDFKVINGLLGLNYTPPISLTDENTESRPEAITAWNEIKEWLKAAEVKATLQSSRFGFLGGNYSGMLDMYSDFTMLQAKTGMHVEILEMCDLDRILKTVTDEETLAKRKEIEELFEICGDSPSDPRVKKPTEEQLNWSARVAAAQQKMVLQYDLDALAYYYHGSDGNDYMCMNPLTG